MGRNLSDCPITTYEDYRSVIESSASINALTAENVTFWGVSTGTTGPQKRFPLSKSYLKAYETAAKTFLMNLLSRKPSMLSGKVASFVVPMNGEIHGSTGVMHIGQAIYQSMPAISGLFYAIPKHVYADENLYNKQHVFQLLKSDISLITASVPSSVLALKTNIALYLEKQLEQLKGTKRYQLLKQIDPADFTLCDIWPNLNLVLAWQTSICKASSAELKKVAGEAQVVNQAYAATEGFFNIYVEDDKPVLYPIDFIYEFIKPEQPETILKPWDIQESEEYEILITSPMGFVRYRIGDIIKCTGFYNKLPMIEFVRKTRNQVSLGWVTIDESEIIDVLLKLGINDFDLVSVRINNSGQGLVITLHQRFATQIESFDRRLAEINRDFAREQQEGRIDPSRVVIQNNIPRPAKHAQTKDQVLIVAT